MGTTLALGVAIVSYRSTTTLPMCLAAIRDFCPEAFVIVVENGGDAEDVQVIAASATPLDVMVIDPGENVGYARGVNLAAAQLQLRGCEYLLILNPDVVLTANPVDLVPLLDRAQVVAGALAPHRVRGSSGPPEYIAASNVKREVTWRSSLVQAVLGTRFNGLGSVPRGQLTYVPQVDGAYLLQEMAYYVRDPLDEAFELYFEDVAYCDRARAGRGVAILGLQVGIHLAGVSASQSNGLAYVVNRVSRARYLRRKYRKWPAVVVAAPFVVEVMARALTRQPEGGRIRREGLRKAVSEVKRPGSVMVLARSGRTPRAGAA